MLDRPIYAPRCFGLGSMFGMSISMCRVCPAHDECLPLAKLSLKRTHETIGETHVALAHVSVRIDETTEVHKTIKAITEKTINGHSKANLAVLIGQIKKSNPCAVDYMETRRNPFGLATKPAYLKPLIDHYFKVDSTDEGLVEFLVRVFDKKEKDAQKMIALLRAAFEALGHTI